MGRRTKAGRREGRRERHWGREGRREGGREGGREGEDHTCIRMQRGREGGREGTCLEDVGTGAIEVGEVGFDEIAEDEEAVFGGDETGGGGREGGREGGVDE